MKSAYELAMERLAKEDPDASSPLTDEQKQRLAAIDQKFEAKIAEREVFLKSKLAEARTKRDAKAVQDIEVQIRNERIRLREESESEKERVRKQPAS